MPAATYRPYDTLGAASIATPMASLVVPPTVRLRPRNKSRGRVAPDAPMSSVLSVENSKLPVSVPPARGKYVVAAVAEVKYVEAMPADVGSATPPTVGTLVNSPSTAHNFRHRRAVVPRSRVLVVVGPSRPVITLPPASGTYRAAD